MGKHLAQFPEGRRSGKQANSTAVLLGHLVVYTDATDLELVARCAADHSALVAGVAAYDGSSGDGTGKEIGYFTSGDVLVRNTSGGAISAGALLVSSSGGGVKAAAATNTNWVGKALEGAADGEMLTVRLDIQTAILA